MDLIFIINRDYLLQEYTEQLMELSVAYGVDRLVFVDLANTMAQVKNIRPAQLETYICYSLLAALELVGGTPVYFEEGQALTLEEFNPPADAVYIFGPDRGGQEVPEGAIGVTIETQTDRHLWSQQAAAIALYDCQIKSGCLVE